jgi:hypothetical protein
LTWKDSRAVEAVLAGMNATEQAALSHLHALSTIVVGSIPVADFAAPRGIAATIPLSDHAVEIVALLSDSTRDQSEDEIAFAFLYEFYHHNLLIDHARADLATLTQLISDTISTNNLRLTYRFGRLLYDKFYDNEFLHNDHLSPEDVDALIDGTPAGIYQVGNLLTGPFGILNSKSRRFLPPIRNLPLWHCADTGCRTVHHVSLRRHQVSYLNIASEIARSADKSFGPYSEWGPNLARLQRPNESIAREFSRLPALLADTVVFGERTTLLTEALRSSDGDFIRNHINEIRQNLGKGNPSKVASGLSEIEQLQLLLLLDDSSIISLLDESILSRAIKIPTTETRSSRFDIPSLYNTETDCTMSCFGVRADHDDPALLLSSMVWKEYESRDLLSDLSWRCGGGTDSPHPGVVLEYMKSVGPAGVIRSLVLPSRPITTAIGDRMHFSITQGDPESLTVDRILWKFGFSPSRFDSKYARLSTHLASFREGLLTRPDTLSDDDRDVVRSRGVNAFVSLEHILEEIIAFNVWLLGADHFIQSQYEYEPNIAISYVAEILGDSQSNGSFTAAWIKNGGNTLGTLLLYARTAANWMLALRNRDREKLIRPETDVPHYTDREDRRFVLAHNEFWADADPARLNDFAEAFNRLVTMFEQSRLAEVRNGIDHYRSPDKFPPVDIMIACEARVSAAIEFADLNRFIPKVFWMEQSSYDNYGLEKHALTDYRDRKLLMSGPPSVLGIPSVKFDQPFVVPHGNLLGWPNSDLVFGVKESSEYAAYWAGYPRRRARVTNPELAKSAPEAPSLI